MATTVNEFKVWLLDTPVVTISSENGEFDIWQFDTPIVDSDESNPNQQPRRRPAIY